MASRWLLPSSTYSNNSVSTSKSTRIVSTSKVPRRSRMQRTLNYWVDFVTPTPPIDFQVHSSTKPTPRNEIKIYEWNASPWSIVAMSKPSPDEGEVVDHQVVTELEGSPTLHASKHHRLVWSSSWWYDLGHGWVQKWPSSWWSSSPHPCHPHSPSPNLVTCSQSATSSRSTNWGTMIILPPPSRSPNSRRWLGWWPRSPPIETTTQPCPSSWIADTGSNWTRTRIDQGIQLTIQVTKTSIKRSNLGSSTRTIMSSPTPHSSPSTTCSLYSSPGYPWTAMET